MTTLITNELKNITHPGLVAQCWKHGDPDVAVKEIKDQISDNKLLVVSMIGERLVTLVENLDF
jgi:hypothetical protein